VIMAGKPEQLADLTCTIGHSPVWDDKSGIIYWLDAPGDKIHGFNTADNCLFSMGLAENVSCIVLREKGGFVATNHKGFYLVDLYEESFEMVWMHKEKTLRNRIICGRCDNAGSLWTGTLQQNRGSLKGRVYCLLPDFTAASMLTNTFSLSGLDWAPDNSVLYLSDSVSRAIVSCLYDKKKGAFISIVKNALLFENRAWVPDGICADREGMLWIALWGGGGVIRWNPYKQIVLDRLELPVLNATSCAFGGENMDELFVTTARIETDTSKYPSAGGIFRVKVDVPGITTKKFKE